LPDAVVPYMPMRAGSLLLIIVGGAALCSHLDAQVSKLPKDPGNVDFPGLPKNPPIFSAMTAIWQGALQFDDTADFNGPVSKVDREETQFRNQNVDSLFRKEIISFDDHNHVIKTSIEDNFGVSTVT